MASEATNLMMDVTKSVNYLRDRGQQRDHEAADLLNRLWSHLEHERSLAQTERAVLRKIRALFGLKTEAPSDK